MTFVDRVGKSGDARQVPLKEIQATIHEAMGAEVTTKVREFRSDWPEGYINAKIASLNPVHDAQDEVDHFKGEIAKCFRFFEGRGKSDSEDRIQTWQAIGQRKTEQMDARVNSALVELYKKYGQELSFGERGIAG